MTQSLPGKSLILYADDDPDDILLIKETFRDYEETVQLICFPNGQELLYFLRTIDTLDPKPCLIILDINMPGMDGKVVLREIRQMRDYQDVPVALFSTSTLPSEAAFARSFDASFITKPLTKWQLHKIFDQFMAECSEEIKKRILGSK